MELPAQVLKPIIDLLVDLLARHLGLEEIVRELAPIPARIDEARIRVTNLPAVAASFRHADAPQLEAVARLLLTIRNRGVVHLCSTDTSGIIVSEHC